MEFRKANMGDLAGLKRMFGKVIERMERDGIPIWDDVYPANTFAGDIESGRMYVLADGGGIAAAFALHDADKGETHVKWPGEGLRPMYLERLCVGVEYARMGLGERMLREACAAAKQRGAQALRLFVVDYNLPAIRLYEKAGFARADGLYHLDMDTMQLLEYGFEKRI